MSRYRAIFITLLETYGSSSKIMDNAAIGSFPPNKPININNLRLLNCNFKNRCE